MSIKSSAEAMRDKEVIRLGKGSSVMRCKLILHSVEPAHGNTPEAPRYGVRFGAVWEGSQDRQAASENGIFGRQTPCAEFTATLCNPEVLADLEQGAAYIVTFTKA